MRSSYATKEGFTWLTRKYLPSRSICELRNRTNWFIWRGLLHTSGTRKLTSEAPTFNNNLGVWNTQEEAVAFKTMEQFRRSYGENRSLEAAPGTYFRDDEFVESICCLLQPMMVGWDAYYVPRWMSGNLDYFVSVSHDGFIDIEARTQEMRDKALEILRGHAWMSPLLKY